MLGALGLLTLCSVILSHNAIAQEERKIVTFNTALQFSIPLRHLRRRNLLRVLKTTDADVVCLQEVYHSSDIRWLRKRLSRKFPETTSFTGSLASPVTNEPLCKHPNVFAFHQCMSNNCTGYNTNDVNSIIALFQCLHTQCASHMFSMPQECLTCFFLFPNATEALSVCMNPETKINVPGLFLLSKKGFIEVRPSVHHQHGTEIAKQGFIAANIEGIGTVVCTHLATGFLNGLYPEDSLPYENYAAQNLVEATKLLEAFKDTKPLVLVGDFNTGPQQLDKDVCEYNPESYRALTSPNSDLQHTILDKCTYCKDNTWNHGTCDWIIDHVFVRGITIKDIKVMKIVI